MRPVRIEVEGFSAYREAVAVDFTDTDFFSLTGPTGAGKSSLIDAMIFALFGRVPRLGGNAVAPAISAGADRARVRLDFEVSGNRYTAARVAKRTTSGGASVREARLEGDGTVLASGADDVTDAVEDLLRLRFDDFTRTVVLPQGEFARFLTATKAERQGLLRNLLGLDVYTRMRDLAKSRGVIANERAESSRRALEALDVPDEDSAAAAVERRDSLEELSRSVAAGEMKLRELDEAVVASHREAERLRGAVKRLGAITPPDRLGELDALTVEAREQVETASSALAGAEDAVSAKERALSQLPTLEQIASWNKTREKLAEVENRLDTGALAEAREQSRALVAELAGAKAALEGAREELATARREHAAHTIASTLVAGETCPVCAQVITKTPAATKLPVMADLEDAEDSAARRVETVHAELDAAQTRVTTLETTQHELTAQRKSLLEDLGDAPDIGEVAEITGAVERIQRELITAREELAGRQIDVKEARRSLEDLADTSRRIGRMLTEAQLGVADLDPPVSESDDVIVQWKELLAWREMKLEELGPDLENAVRSIEDAESAAADSREGLARLLESHQIPVMEPFAVQVATAFQAARSTVEMHEKAIRESASLAERAEKANMEAAVAGTLANHLRSNGFEQWLMAGALTELVDGANDLLSQLSDGGYSLYSDDSGTFSIVDHRNADEIRSVATLSGGETFLVSLALALSLAETLAAKGGSGLDAIMLDEGFGSLDEESLDTVAAVLEELTGRGLMVGIVTHVKELAARAPVRYEVTREPAGARVRQVS